MTTVNTSPRTKFFFNQPAAMYGVAWLLARAGLKASEGNAKPVPVTDTILTIALFLLGMITNGPGGRREISLRATERITPWNRRTIARAMELLETAELVAKLPGTNVYSAGPAFTDGRLQNEIDYFSDCISRHEKPEWPTNNDKRRGARKRAKQQPATAPTPEVVQSECTTPLQSEYSTPSTQVVQSECTTPTPRVVQSEYTTQVVQSEYTTPVQSECTTLRGIETTALETSLVSKSEIPPDSDLARLLEGESSTADRSPRSHGPTARARLERSQPPSASPEQPEGQHQTADDLIRLAAAGQRKPAQPAQAEQAEAHELSTDYQLAVDEKGFTVLLNPKPGMLLMYEYCRDAVMIERIEYGYAWVRCDDDCTATVPVVDGQLQISGTSFRPLTQEEAFGYNAETPDVVETYGQCETVERV